MDEREHNIQGFAFVINPKNTESLENNQIEKMIPTSMEILNRDCLINNQCNELEDIQLRGNSIYVSH